MYKREGETAREYLERIPSFAREKSPVSEVRRFLNLLGNPDREFKIFHVAGTNGKGSVCAYLTAVLKEDGKTCGTFVSPHLTDIRERFMVGGELVSEEAFTEAFEVVFEAVSAWTASKNPHPTYFEYLFYMCLVLFRKAGVEFVVLETGMGGLKDVTNVVESPLVSVITSISIDHTAYLGNTLEEIAAHKAGIIKPGCPVVYDSSCQEAAAVIQKRADELAAKAFSVSRVPYESNGDFLKIRCVYRGKEEMFTLPFAAPYQAVNGALAVRALEVSGCMPEASILKSGLKNAVWPARMEQIRPGVYLDGAHNEDGIRAFLEAAGMIKEQKRPERTLLVFAVAADKDYRNMLLKIGRELKPDLCILTRMDVARALSVEELLKTALEVFPPQVETRCFGTAGEAIDALLKEKTGDDLAFIAGSLYLAGEVKSSKLHVSHVSG